MAKRRRKSTKPNLPDDVLARARKNAGIEEEPEAEDDSAASSDADETESVSERAARRRKLSSVQLERSRKRGEMSNDMIEDVLHNPTRVVTEEELRSDYKHVLIDLRNMGLLSAVLIAVLFALAYLVPSF